MVDGSASKPALRQDTTRCEINHQSQNSPKLCEEDIPQLIAKNFTENS